MKTEALQILRESYKQYEHLGSLNKLESYLKEEFRELDLSESWNAIDSKEIDQNNPNNILLWALLGKADIPSELNHTYTGGDWPDIDCDFEPESRDKIKEWLREEYGDTNCMEVATYGGIHVKGAIQDLARIAGIDPQEVYKVTTKINYNVNNEEENTLEWIMENNSDVAKWLNNYPLIRDWTEKMQESKRSIGKHASAFIISSLPIDEYIPIVMGKNKELLTAYQESSSVKALNDVGLIKFDLLGLENLTVIRDTVDMIRDNHGFEVYWDNIDVNDPDCYKLLRQGYNGSLFQLDSPLAAMIISTISPSNFGDLTALNSLIRPSALQSKSHEIYRDHKLGKFDRTKYPVWKDLKGKVSDFTYKLLDMTQGIVIFQEQTMAMMSEFCNVSFDETNDIRKVIGIPANKKEKEHHEYIAEQYKKWMEYGSKKFGEQVSQQWWDVAVGSLSYGFNAAHSTAYAIIGFRQLWLKKYYPKEFYTALLRTTVAKSENLGRSKLMRYIIEAKHLGVEIQSPHVNRSDIKLGFSGDSIYIGFEQIKGIGYTAAQDIVKKAPYSDFDDFIEKHKNDSAVNKRAINALIYTNAFRDFGDRSQLLEKYWRSLLPKKRKDEEIELPNHFSILQTEHNLLTIVLSEENPMELPYGYIPVTKALDTRKDRVCKIKGIAKKISWHVSRNGNKYARIVVNDLENSAIVLVWRNFHAKLKQIAEGDIIQLTVKHLDGETFSLLGVNEVERNSDD